RSASDGVACPVAGAPGCEDTAADGLLEQLQVRRQHPLGVRLLLEAFGEQTHGTGNQRFEDGAVPLGEALLAVAANRGGQGGNVGPLAHGTPPSPLLVCRRRCNSFWQRTYRSLSSTRSAWTTAFNSCLRSTSSTRFSSWLNRCRKSVGLAASRPEPHTCCNSSV